MKMHKLSPVATMLALAACNGIDTVNYHQVGACNGYQIGNNVFSAGPNAAYVFYKIESIDATGNSQSALSYNPNLQYTIDPVHSSRDFFDPTLSIYANILGPFAVGGVTVPTGSIVGVNGYGALVVSTTAADGASEADHTVYGLQYNTPASSTGIVMNNTNASRASWPYTPNCQNITLQ